MLSIAGVREEFPCPPKPEPRLVNNLSGGLATHRVLPVARTGFVCYAVGKT